MRKFLIYISNSHETILKAVIIIITVVVIAALLPHKVRYKFDFQKAKPGIMMIWFPYDFSVFKDPDSLKAEQWKVQQDVLPHFQLDSQC